ncbi:MAG: N-acetyl-gamma-glutamyl-phosphate reductase [Candidatus Nealsonbacteria bacterium]|nr:N-acetyl-gamma-glutamyl-phosphate reductase [Candidatus Nealsonbacteria bacterium]
MKIAVLGSTGIQGGEAVKKLVGRKDIEIVCTSSSKKIVGNIEDAEGVIVALQHKEAMEQIPYLPGSIKFVFDLSGAYRLKDPEAYPKWYGFEHTHPHLLKYAVYGLPEINRALIGKTWLISVPGCYETAIILGLNPLIRLGLVDSLIRVNALSGYTGAGKDAKIPKRITPYKSGIQHQHIPAIKQELKFNGKLFFFPEIGSFPRGILARIMVKTKKSLTKEELNGIYKEIYQNEPFVRVKEEVRIDEVLETNFCHMACYKKGEWVEIDVVIDNLGKGGAWQAIQNLNIVLGLPETTGLL